MGRPPVFTSVTSSVRDRKVQDRHRRSGGVGGPGSETPPLPDPSHCSVSSSYCSVSSALVSGPGFSDSFPSSSSDSPRDPDFQEVTSTWDRWAEVRVVSWGFPYPSVRRPSGVSRRSVGASSELAGSSSYTSSCLDRRHPTDPGDFSPTPGDSSGHRTPTEVPVGGGEQGGGDCVGRS